MGRNTKKRGKNSENHYYSDDMTKEVVGRLFEQYAAEDGKNYFAPTGYKNAHDDEDELAQKEEDKRSFFEENEEEEEPVKEKKKESRLSRFVRKAKLAVLPHDDDDDDDEDDEEFENILDEQAEEGPLQVPDGELPPEIAQQQTYVPRRKERPKKNKPQIQDEEENIEDIFGSSSEQEEPVIEKPKKLSVRERIEQRVDAKRRQNEPEQVQPADNAQFDEDYYDEDEEVFEIPVARGVLIAIVVIIFLVIIGLFLRCGKLSSQLKEANNHIEELERMNTSSTYEKELEELRAKNEELTKQIEDIQAASAVVTEGGSGTAPTQPSGSDPTVGADGQGDTSLSQNPSSDRSYEVIQYSGGTPWELAEEYYGDGNRYMEIVEFNNMTLEDFETITYGTELKIPN